MLIHEKLSDQTEMSEIDANIATYFLNQPDSIKNLSGRKMAEALFVAPSTITRFCKKIGYNGYNDFKEAYLSEYDYLQSHFKEIDPNHPFKPKDSSWTIANRVCQLYTETVSDTLAIQTYELIERAVHFINRSNKIFIYSAGNHINLANHFKNKMLEIGQSVEVIQRFDLAFYSINYATPKDCFLFISYSGETNDMLRVLNELKNKEIPTLALTSFGDNTLSEFADVSLKISTREKLINNSGTFSSDLSVMYLLDILYANIFAKNHQKVWKKRNAIAKSYQKYRYSTNPLIQD
ncbi:MurR/RpiR family transcriptional regulator [Enterococcus sp. DIV0098]|uniref:MurR/RpiR family transcriptional regulator n=1 Tax=Enterococcus sp. DIV0098 TaxID=2774843 RepID=UPI003F249556